MEVKTKITGYDLTVRYSDRNGLGLRVYDLCHIEVEDECYANIGVLISSFLNNSNETALTLREDEGRLKQIKEAFRGGRRLVFPDGVNHVIIDCPNVFVKNEIFHLSLGVWRTPSIGRKF